MACKNQEGGRIGITINLVIFRTQVRLKGQA
jgi:hypothetical protein